MSIWQKWRSAILGTLAVAGIWLAAIVSHQPTVLPPPLPIASCGVSRWATTNTYTTTVNNWTVTIKAGFVTDLASIPDQAAGPLALHRDSPSVRRGGLVHDALYASQLITKEEADSILYACCLEDGTDPDKARAIWEAVHLYGFTSWDSKTPESISAARELVRVSHP